MGARALQASPLSKKEYERSRHAHIMRLLLVAAVDTKRGLEIREPPLGLGYIAAYVRQHMPSVEIAVVDRHIDGALQRFDPDLVGVSCVSQNFGLAGTIGKRCHQVGLPTFVGGVHISALPHSLPPDIDFGVVGEGEETVLEVLQAFDSSGFGLDQLRHIKGLVLRDDAGQPFVTGKRDLISPLDTIPFPARDLLLTEGSNRVHLLSSRGCPYNCAFCFSSRFWQSVRFFSPQYVVSELEAVIVDHAPAQIAFWDDLFIADRPRLRQIVDLVEARKINRKVEFYVTARANLVTPEVVRLLKRMNVVMVSMGLESGCQRTLRYLKGEVTVEQNHRAVALLKAASIYVNATFIIGCPDEQEEEIIETLDFIRESKLDTFSVYVLTPYPGTPVWEYALARGLVSNIDMDWRRLAIDWDDEPSEKVVLSEKVPRDRLRQLCDLFESERRQRRIKYGVSRGLRQPRFLVRAVHNAMLRRIRA